MFLAAPKKKQT